MQLVSKSSVWGCLLILCCALVVAGCEKPNAKKTPDQPAPNSTEVK